MKNAPKSIMYSTTVYRGDLDANVNKRARNVYRH